MKRLISELPSESSAQASFTSIDDEKCEDNDTIVFFKSFPRSRQVIRAHYSVGLTLSSSNLVSVEKLLSTFEPRMYEDDKEENKSNRLYEIESRTRHLIARSEKQYFTEMNPRVARSLYKKTKKKKSLEVSSKTSSESQSVVVNNKQQKPTRRHSSKPSRRPRLSSMKRRELVSEATRRHKK